MLNSNDMLDIELRNRGNADIATLINQIEHLAAALGAAKRHFDNIEAHRFEHAAGGDVLEQDEDYVALDRLLDEVA